MRKGAPGAEARNPAGNVGAKLSVLGTERFPQSRLFVNNNKNKEGDPDESCVLQNAGIPKQQALADDHQQDSNVHWVTNVAVQAGNDQMFGRSHRCRCADSLECKAREGIQKNRNTSENEQNAKPAE